MKNQNYQWQKLTMGVCYYPEHWPKELWASDLDRMKEVGISTVRVAEFAWSLFEPEEGRFCFDFFDEFLALCAKKNMSAIMGTPTATPPVWLTERYPEVLNANKAGVLYRHGSRRHYNYNSEVYQRLCARIVEALALHYGQHPAVVGWQIDNELNCETNEFYSEADHEAFRNFVRHKYGSLDNLNQAWGAVFWSQTYTDWNQIYAPRPVVGPGNPHQLLDYCRFISESTIRFCKLQADILRKYKKPGDFITTNGMFGNLDNVRMAAECLDVYTYDSYPNFAFGMDSDPKHSNDLNDRGCSRHLTQVRAVCPHFGVMEQQSGANSWGLGQAPRPGQLGLWAMQSVAQGADYISFFRWRTCPFGSEQHWHGILDYDDRDNRKLDEVREFYKKIQSIEPVCGAKNFGAFALLKDYDNEWGSQADAWHRRIQQQSELEIFVAAELSHTPYNMVILNEDTSLADLSEYPVVIYPHPVMMNEQRAKLLKDYVAQGGTLIIGCCAGYKDLSGKCVMLPKPGLLQELTGTDIWESTFVSPNGDESFALWGETRIETPVFNDILTPMAGTKVLARFGSSYYAGEAALTEKAFGKGRTIYWGSTFTRRNTRQLLDFAGVLEPFRDHVEAPAEVELVMREKDGRRFLFCLNYLPEQQRIVLKRASTLLYTGETVTGTITLPAFGTAVYELN